MQDRSSKRPRDPNQLAKLMVDIATSDVAEASEPIVAGRVKDPAAVALGRRGGLKGGAARASKMSADDRSTIARKAAVARWSDKGKNK